MRKKKKKSKKGVDSSHSQIEPSHSHSVFGTSKVAPINAAAARMMSSGKKKLLGTRIKSEHLCGRCGEEFNTLSALSAHRKKWHPSSFAQEEQECGDLKCEAGGSTSSSAGLRHTDVPPEDESADLSVIEADTPQVDLISEQLNESDEADDSYEEASGDSEDSSSGCEIPYTTDQLKELKLHLVGLLEQAIEEGTADEQADLVKKLRLAISFESNFSDFIASEYGEEEEEEVADVYVDEDGVEYVCDAEDVYEGEDGHIYLYETEDDLDDEEVGDVPATNVSPNTPFEGGDDGASKKDDSDGDSDQTGKTGISFNVEDFLA
jgi:hypothetical protein